MQTFKTSSADETQRIGHDLACAIIKNGLQSQAIVLALAGNLGGGKTTFLQGFAAGLGIKEKILSPTFVIQKKFSIDIGSVFGWENFYHFDCYRINNPKEVLDLDFKKIILNPKNIVAIEWSEKIKNYIPKSALFIEFKFIGEMRREIVFNQDQK